MAGGKLISTGVEFPDATTQTTSGLPLTGGALTGAVTTTSTFDGRDVAADGVTADAALPKAGGTMTGTIAGFTSTGIDDNATSTAITITDDYVDQLTTLRAYPTRDTYIDNAEDGTNRGKIFITGPNAGDFASEAGHLVIQARVHTSVYRDIIFAGGTTTAGPLLTVKGEGDVTVNTGNLVIGTSGKGIDFSATSDGSGTMTSEVLDDYEEGTFTPTMLINADSTGITYGYSFGTYTKIGRKVTVNLRISITNKGTNTGQVKIGGLPFAIGNTLNSTGYESAVNIYTWNSLATNVYHLGGTTVESSSLLYLFGNNAASGDINDLTDTYLTNASTFRMSCTYFT